MKKNDKKNDKKSEAKNDDKQRQQLQPRYEIVDPKRVFDELERHKLSTSGTENERTDRLSSFYVHEAQKAKGAMIDCQPDDPDDPLGCRIKSPDGYNVCPFCGKGGVIVTALPSVPKADRDIELNVKAASGKKTEPATPVVEPKKDGDAAATVKVSAKDVKEKKKARGEDVEGKPAQDKSADAPKADAIAKQEAIDLPSESAGGTAADLDRIAAQIDAVTEGMLQNQALSMWEIGQLLAEIRDKKLWSTVRNEGDGGYSYVNFNSFVAQRFDFTPDHAMLMIRIATAMTRENAAIGSAKAKAILDAKLPDDMVRQLVAFASERDERGNFIHSLVELRVKIKNLKEPQLPPASTANAAMPAAEEDTEDRDDADDEDGDKPESVRSVKAVKPAQMTSVSFEKREFSVPLAIKGSQFKPAKKIQDEPHGTLSLPGGTKIHFVVKIGDEGQFVIDGKVETPY